jgi:hypothetical protein
MRGQIYSLPIEIIQYLLHGDYKCCEEYSELFIDYFNSLGMQIKRSRYLKNKLCDDLRIMAEEDRHKILWAFERGFIPSRIKLYSLSESNYVDYLSDFDYFILHPLNNHFAFWINDKVTLKYMLQKPMATDQGYMDIMPKYYLYIENDGRYSYLMDSPSNIQHDSDYLLNLVKEIGVLALKPSNGGAGVGFVKLEYKDETIFFNSQAISEEDFNCYKEKLNGYIVTEYITQHSELSKVWNHSICTLRVIAINTWNNAYSSNTPTVLVSYARFGTSKSNETSNLSTGGVGVPFDFETGKYADYFFQYFNYCDDYNFVYNSHPDTSVQLGGQLLPNWKYVQLAVNHVCKLLSSLEYFGFDIIITNDGVKLCEINSHPSLDYEQVICPLYKNPDAKMFFERKLLNKANQLNNSSLLGGGNLLALAA